MLQSWLSRIMLGAFLVYCAVFLALPELDLHVSAFFFVEGEFVSHQIAWVKALYLAFANVFLPLAVALLLYCLVGWLLPKVMTAPAFFRFTKQALFALLLLLICSIFVEVVLKLGFGRPRPRDISEFFGTLQFAPFLTISDQCSKNCSFASGHAAIGFYFMGIAWLANKSWLLIFGFAFGCALALSRVMMGGHFLSDVIAPFFIVFFIAELLANWLLKVRL